MTAVPLFSDPVDRTLALSAPAAAPPMVGLFREPPAGQEPEGGEEPGDEEIAAALAAAAAGRRPGPEPRFRK